MQGQEEKGNLRKVNNPPGMRYLLAYERKLKYLVGTNHPNNSQFLRLSANNAISGRQKLCSKFEHAKKYFELLLSPRRKKVQLRPLLSIIWAGGEDHQTKKVTGFIFEVTFL